MERGCAPVYPERTRGTTPRSIGASLDCSPLRYPHFGLKTRSNFDPLAGWIDMELVS